MFALSAFWLWAALSFAVAASLMVAHTYTLPRPLTDDPELAEKIASTRTESDGQRWRALHILYTRCRCSERILTELGARGPVSGVSERVVLVGEPGEHERALRAVGFSVEVIAPEELVARYGAHAAPLLIVADSEDELRYVGGYTERKQGLATRDATILTELVAGHDVAELPLFGCAVSSSLRALLDPLGLRRMTERGP